MYVLRFCDNFVICVLLFSKDLFVVEDEGFIVKIVIWCFLLVRKFLKVLINVDFLFFGGFDKLILKEYGWLFENGGVCFECLIILESSFCVWWYLIGWRVFINVMVCVKFLWLFWMIFWNNCWMWYFLFVDLILRFVV